MQREWAIQLVQRAIREHEDLEQTKYTLTYTISDIGSDSLDVVEMVMLVEDYIHQLTHDHKQQFVFPTSVANGITTKSTIDDLIKMVEQYGPTVSISPSPKKVQ